MITLLSDDFSYRELNYRLENIDMYNQRYSKIEQAIVIKPYSRFYWAMYGDVSVFTKQITHPADRISGVLERLI